MSDGQAAGIGRLCGNEEVLRVAERVIWFMPPRDALRDPAGFLAHLMTYGTIEDVNVILRYLTLDDFRKVLDDAPPGVFDRRSWAYWNLICGRDPSSPMPQRRLDQPR